MNNDRAMTLLGVDKLRLDRPNVLVRLILVAGDR